jgi:hypothetical protein
MENGVCFFRGLGRYVIPRLPQNRERGTANEIQVTRIHITDSTANKKRDKIIKRGSSLLKKSVTPRYLLIFFPIPLNLFFDKQVNNVSGFVFCFVLNKESPRHFDIM